MADESKQPEQQKDSQEKYQNAGSIINPETGTVDFAKLQSMMMKDMNNFANERKRNIKYSQDQVVQFLKAPQKNQEKLRDVSRYLFSYSPHYKKLIEYYANMLLFYYTVSPHQLDITKLQTVEAQKDYKKRLMTVYDKLEKMNMPHEFNKICKTVMKEDVFYGYEHENKMSYMIQKLDPDYCALHSVIDGVFSFQFDFAYFDEPKHYQYLDEYPQEFQQKYQIYRNNFKLRWQALDPQRSICIKLNDDIDYPLPPFASIFPGVFDIDDYKMMKKEKTKMDTYQILTQKIPVDTTSGNVDSFLIDSGTAQFFHNRASQSTPDGVGMLTSPMDIQSIKLSEDKADINRVEEAESEFYTSAGVSEILFNSQNTSTTGLNKSISADEEIAFSLLRQFERWVNRKLKYQIKKFRFKVKFLNVTEFSKDNVFEQNLKAAQFGVVGKFEVAASKGVSPAELVNNNFVEEDIFELGEKLVPLSSSHTSSGNESGQDGAGRPPSDDDDLDEAGETAREQDGNDREE